MNLCFENNNNKLLLFINISFFRMCCTSFLIQWEFHSIFDSNCEREGVLLQSLQSDIYRCELRGLHEPRPAQEVFFPTVYAGKWRMIFSNGPGQAGKWMVIFPTGWAGIWWVIFSTEQAKPAHDRWFLNRPGRADKKRNEYFNGRVWLQKKKEDE